MNFELVGHLGSVQRSGATERNEREAAGIEATFDRYPSDGPLHRGMDDPNDAECCRFDVHGQALADRADRAVAQGMVFIPFCYAEAAANLLTNPQLDPFGKIPEYKFCAAKVEAVDPATRVAAE